MNSERRGILAGGNFIVDHVKVIDHYPAQDMLASILSQSSSNGGGPYNVLKDLAALQAGFPLAAAGMVGQDAEGDYILKDCTAHGIDVGQLRRSTISPTSYTDAMTVKGTGRRTFFHQRGANALLDVDDFRFEETSARLFHLGYLMLLDRLDTFDETGTTRAARVLEKAKRAGLETSVDIVSTEHPQFVEIARSALPYTDHLIINEVEASRILGRPLPADDARDLLAAAGALIDAGVAKVAVIHTEAGAVAASKDGPSCSQGALCLPPSFSQGATGAGDAFAAGYLYGLHEGLAPQERLRLAVCTAATSLSHPTASAGLRPVAECLALGESCGFRAFA